MPESNPQLEDRSVPARQLVHGRREVSGAVARAMELDELRSHVLALISLDQTEAPIVSCYVHRSVEPDGSWPAPFDERLRVIRSGLGGQARQHVEEAVARIERYFATEVRSTTRGVAVFARAGRRPFFLGLQFQVPLPDRLSVSSTPDIYHLVELKDTYHRYVVLISTEESSRILEVNLGAITRELWTARPELRERVGEAWTHEHYQNHGRDRGEWFLKEKIAILEKLMASGGHTHLILAGSPTATDRVRACLPEQLLAKLVDVVPAPTSARVADVVEATLSSFIDRERQESLDAVTELTRALRRGGLAVAGTAATLEALRRGQADVLVMARAYEPGLGWTCRRCSRSVATTSSPERCSGCGSSELQSANLKEVMVKLAEWQSLEVEIVAHSDVLMELGGVGCLVRYATPEAA